MSVISAVPVGICQKFCRIKRSEAAILPSVSNVAMSP